MLAPNFEASDALATAEGDPLHADDAPVDLLVQAVFAELHLTEVCGGVQPQAAAAFFTRKGLARVGQLRKSRANQRLNIQLEALGKLLLKTAPLDVRAPMSTQHTVMSMC